MPCWRLPTVCEGASIRSAEGRFARRPVRRPWPKAVGRPGGLRTAAEAAAPGTNSRQGRLPGGARAGGGNRRGVQRRIAAAVGEDSPTRPGRERPIFEPDLPLAGLKARLVCTRSCATWARSAISIRRSRASRIASRLDAVAFGVVTEKPARGRQSDAAAGRNPRHSGRAARSAKRSSPGVRPSPPRGQATASLPPRKGRDSLPQTLRVDLRRLDQLMNLAGQLAIGPGPPGADRGAAEGGRSGKKGPVRIVPSGPRAVGANVNGPFSSSIGGGLVDELAEAIHTLERVGEGMQRQRMEMRMVPIGPLFARFHRMVRDIAHAGGKEIRLVLSGEKTELDKRMIDRTGRSADTRGSQCGRPRHRIAAGLRGGGKAAAGHDLA